MQMKEKVKKEKKLRTPIQLNLKVNIGIIVAIVVAIFIAIPLLKGKEASKREAMQIITESNLHKIIEVSQLSTYECVYNDVCTVMDKEDSSKIAYYCKYNGRVKAGIDFSKVEIAVKEQEDGLLLITVTLPEVTLGEPEVVFRKADAALNQIRANTGSTKATRKVTRIQGRIHHVQAAAVACAVLIGAGGITATAAVIHHLWSRGMQANIQATAR